MNPISIKLEGLGIKYFIRQEGARGLRAIFQRRKKVDLWALKGIDLEVRKGEIFGVIGSNGAGKSTLLKALSGIIPVTEGTVALDGRIAPLIELGAAFNPELTGAENIYLTGSIYRVPRRVIREKFDSIVEFAGLRKFIHSPVKNYSSGMFIRLAFSIVIFFEPDVVLIDEVFAVGDAVFQQRSFEKILEFRERGATIVLVTHDLDFVSRICDRTLVLSNGRASFLGPTAGAIAHYLELIKKKEGIEEGTAPSPRLGADSKRWGNEEVELREVQFVDHKGAPTKFFQTGDYFEARIIYHSRLQGETPIFGVALSTIHGLLIYGPNTLNSSFPERIPSDGIVRFIIPRLPLLDGEYLFSVSAYDHSLKTAYDHHSDMYYFRVLKNPRIEFGAVRIESHWELLNG
ncbi:MAG: ABC transporter ATP-binding protein [Candidatus Aminicenantales bacterium]